MSTQETTPRTRLVKARQDRKLSQQQVAEDLGTTSVNVSRWERGITRPGPYFRHKLAILFKKSEQELDLQPIPGEDEEISLSATPQASTLQENVPVLYDWTIPRPPAFPLIGRKDELHDMRQRLISGGSVALTALNGLPGVGKTALTIALAHDPAIREHFRDGVLWAGLGPEPQNNVLLSHWGKLLGLSEAQMAILSTPRAWGDALREAIGRRALLLVVDDAWTLDAAQAFMVGGPACAHLVTTRFPNIASHISIDGAFTLRELNSEHGMDLLRQLAPQVVVLEEGKALDLVEAVGGLPLALTLMGNYLRKQGYTGQARRIQAALLRLSDARERLTLSEQRAPIEKHPSLAESETQVSLQSVISVTDQFLNAQQRAALHALAVFPPRPNSFSEEAALVVAACDYDMLDALNDTGLLESSGSGRYTLHQTIADYARLRLLDEAAAATAYTHLIDYVIIYVEQHRKDYELLDLESTTILAALEAAQRLGKQRELIRAVIAFAPFMLLRALYTQAEEHFQHAHQAALALDDKHDVASALLYLGQVEQKQGNFAQAEAYFQSGLELAREIGDEERVCAVLTDLGWIVWRRGNFAQAEAYLQEGLTIARKINNIERLCALLKILGSVIGSRGDYTQAEKYLQEGLPLTQQIGDREQTCSLLMNLGAVEALQGHYEQAKFHFREGLALAQQMDYRESICAIFINLGDIASEEKNYTLAEEYFQKGLLIARQIGHREWTSILLLNLGETSIDQKKFLEAEDYLEESLDLSRQIERHQITANALYQKGILRLSKQQLEEAEAMFHEAIATIPKGNQELFALAHYGLARTANAKEDFGEAKKLGEIGASILESMKHRKATEVRNWFNNIKKI